MYLLVPKFSGKSSLLPVFKGIFHGAAKHSVYHVKIILELIIFQQLVAGKVPNVGTQKFEVVGKLAEAVSIIAEVALVLR